MRSEEECKEAFYEEQAFWHLFSPGNLSGILLKEKEEYVDAMNIIALCAWANKSVKILTFQVMSNHFHFVIAANETDVISFGELVKKRIKRAVLKGTGSDISSKFSFKYIKIENLLYLRNVIAYVNRNGYVVSEDHTPFSYPWGANNCFFNPLQNILEKRFLKELSIKDKRKIFKTHNIDLPANYYFTDGYINPCCYCYIDIAQNVFRNAHEYFSIISRRVESFSDIAKELEDRVFYTDSEIYQIIIGLCIKNYNIKKPSELPATEKIKMAILLKNKYNCTKKQISRILSIDLSIISQLFPTV